MITIKFKIDDTVIIKNRKCMSSDYPKWINDATKKKIELKIVKPVPMKGYVVRSKLGDEYTLNSCDLRIVLK